MSHISKKQNELYLCVVGSFGVGKTSLINRFINNIFAPKHSPTLSIYTSAKDDINLYDFPCSLSNSTYQSYIDKADVIIFVYDVTKPESLDYIDKFYKANQIDTMKNQPRLVCVANKSDEKSQVDEMKLTEMLTSRGIKNFSVSAKDDIGINDLFVDILSNRPSHSQNLQTDTKLTPGVLSKHLSEYIQERQARSSKQYSGFFSLPFSKLFGGYSFDEKKKAIAAFKTVFSSPDKKLDVKYLGPLTQGRLGKLIKDLDINLDDYVEQNLRLPRSGR